MGTNKAKGKPDRKGASSRPRVRAKGPDASSESTDFEGAATSGPAPRRRGGNPHPITSTDPATAAAGEQRKADLESKVFPMLLAGVPQRKIAETLGCDQSTVSRIKRRVLDALRAEILDSAGEYLLLELERLSAITLAHWPERSNVNHARVLLQISRQRILLLGLEGVMSQGAFQGGIPLASMTDTQRRARMEAVGAEIQDRLSRMEAPPDEEAPHQNRPDQEGGGSDETD